MQRYGMASLLVMRSRRCSPTSVFYRHCLHGPFFLLLTFSNTLCCLQQLQGQQPQKLALAMPSTIPRLQDLIHRAACPRLRVGKLHTVRLQVEAGQLLEKHQVSSVREARQLLGLKWSKQKVNRVRRAARAYERDPVSFTKVMDERVSSPEYLKLLEQLTPKNTRFDGTPAKREKWLKVGKTKRGKQLWVATVGALHLRRSPQLISRFPPWTLPYCRCCCCSSAGEAVAWGGGGRQTGRARTNG